jgi:hypothetical protein
MVMKNKRGQEGDLLKTLVVIILLVIFAGIVIYLILQFGGTAKGVVVNFDVRDSDIKYTACSTFYSPSFKDSFCGINLGEESVVTVKDENGKAVKSYVTCQYPDFVERLYDDGKIQATSSDDATKEIESFCGGTLEEVAKEECEEFMKTSDLEKVWINGFTFNRDCGSAEPEPQPEPQPEPDDD